MADIPLNFRAMTVVVDSAGTSITMDFLEADLNFTIPRVKREVQNNGALTSQYVNGIEPPVTFDFKAKCVDDQLVSTIRPKLTTKKTITFRHGWGTTTDTNFTYCDAEVSWNSSEDPNMLTISGIALGYNEGADSYGAQ